MERQAEFEFRNQLREARAKALANAEAFDEIIHVLERFGKLEHPAGSGLANFKPKLEAIANRSSLAEPSDDWRCIHIPFNTLFEMVREARNDAVHQGAFARHLTDHAIQLAIILEDALLNPDNTQLVADYMVRGVVCAEMWHPVSFVRQRMLTSSFSYLPVCIVKGDVKEWRLISDTAVAQYLQRDRKTRLAQPLSKAAISLTPAKTCYDTELIIDIIDRFDGEPILVHRRGAEADLIGILTSFDVL